MATQLQAPKNIMVPVLQVASFLFSLDDSVLKAAMLKWGLKKLYVFKKSLSRKVIETGDKSVKRKRNCNLLVKCNTELKISALTNLVLVKRNLEARD